MTIPPDLGARPRIVDALESMRENPRLSWLHPLLSWALSIPESNLPRENVPALVEPPAFLGLEEYEGTEKRLAGQHLMMGEVAERMTDTIPLYYPEIRFLPHSYFQAWIANGKKLPPEIADKIRSEGQAQIERSLKHAVAIRRAFEVDGEKIPGGPTHNDLRTGDDVLEAIAGEDGFFQFACKKGLDQREDAKISLFMQEWIDPPDIVEAKGNVELLPAGGNAYVEALTNDGGVIVKVRACLGDNSGIDKAHPQIDSYRLKYKPGKNGKPGSVKILSSTIYPHKTVMKLQRSTPPDPILNAVDTTPEIGKGDSHIYEVPIDVSTGVAKNLIDSQDLLRIGTAVGLTYEITGNTYKVEFTKGIFKAKSGKGTVTSIAILEAVPFGIPEINGKEETMYKGRMRMVLSNEKDIELLEKNAETWKEKNPLVFLSMDLINRFTAHPELADRIKQIKRKLTITGYFSDTEHKARELAAAHILHQISATTVMRNMLYELRRRDGLTYLVPISGRLNKQIIPRVVSIEQAIAQGIAQPEYIGGKAAGIAALRENNFDTPPTLALTNAFFDQIIKANGLSDIVVKIRKARDVESLQQLFQSVIEKLTFIPRATLREIRNSILATFSSDPEFDGLVAVRSNATFEDWHRSAPFAGKLESCLDVQSGNLKELEQSILDVMRSYFASGSTEKKSDIAKALFADFSPQLLASEVLKNFAGSIMIQPMVKDVIASGVVFGTEQTGKKRRNMIVMQAALGKAAIVGGDSSKSHIKATFNTTTRVLDGGVYIWDGEAYHSLDLKQITQVDRANHILTEREMWNIFLLAEQANIQLHDPQDIEFAVTGNGRIRILQARPL